MHIAILRLALGTHLKGGHGRMAPVVGKIADNGKAGTTMGTVDQRIADAMFLYLQVAQAFTAYCNIRTDLGNECAFIAALPDFKGIEGFIGYLQYLQRLY